MEWKKIVGGVFLVICCFVSAALAEVSFNDLGYGAGYLDPGDQGIVVQKIRVSNTSSQAALFDVITVRNTGTATHKEVIRIELRDGGALIGSVDDPIGLSSGGVAIPVDYTLPAGATVEIKVLVGVADVTQINGGETLILEVRFHYFVGTTAYTSSWIADGETEQIVKAGFDEIQETVLPAGNYDPGDGNGNPVQVVTFTDNDANGSSIRVNEIRVRNLGTGVAVDDIAAVKVMVRYEGVDYEETKVPNADFNDGGLAFYPATEFGAWDGDVADDAAIEITVEIQVAGDPTDGRTVQTEIILELVEQQPGGDQGFIQTSQAPTVQIIRNAGVEEMEERSTPPSSGVLNPGEILTQTIVVRDADVNANQPKITRIWGQNQGSAGDGEIADIKVKVNGAVINSFNTFSGFATSGVWLDITDQQLDDDGELTLQILYRIGNITPGHTLQPRVKIESYEPAGTGPYETSTVDFPTVVELRPAGFEYAEDVALDSATVYTGQRFCAQKIRLQDKDENDDGVSINPVVVRNTGTAQASDITKIEIRDADGNLLGETTDVAGFDSGGVAISTVQNNVVADDDTIELWVWVTVAGPETANVEDTICLETTVYHLEDGATHEVTVASGATFTIALNHRPVVGFSWSPSEPTWEDEITFTPTVSDPDGDVIVWSQWDFGDGSDPVVRDGPPESVTHTYPNGGTFTVTLTVRDARGLTGSKEKEIHVRERPNQPPHVDFNWTPANPGVGQEVTFNPTVSDPDGDEIATYSWDFGDGSNPLEGEGAPGPVTHAYDAPGDYRVTLTVTDARGAENSATKTVTVINRPPRITSLSNEPLEPEVDQEVTFSATASDPEGDEITDWQWDFDGDGAVDSTQAPPVTYTYERDGIYTVKVRAKDAGSESWGEWYQKTIYVRPKGGPEVGLYVLRNPARTQATLRIFLPQGATNAVLYIYDLLGHLILQREVSGGEFRWDLTDENDVLVPSGLYFALVVAEKDGKPIRSRIGRILVIRQGG